MFMGVSLKFRIEGLQSSEEPGNQNISPQGTGTWLQLQALHISNPRIPSPLRVPLLTLLASEHQAEVLFVTRRNTIPMTAIWSKQRQHHKARSNPGCAKVNPAALFYKWKGQSHTFK